MGISELRVADEVAARLGTPTVESLRTRLLQDATCLGCSQPLGQGPVAVIGQQIRDVAVVIGAHSDCRESEWIDADTTGEISLPAALPIEGPAAALGWPKSTRRAAGLLGRLASWFQPTVPTLVAFPVPEWVWVRLVGPGETVNDDLSYFRERFGLSSDPHAVLPRLDGQAWLDEHGQLWAELGDHRFTAPVDDERLARKIGKARRMQLILVSGVDVGPEHQVKVADIVAAVDDGRTAFGSLPMGPGEPAPTPEEPAAQPERPSPGGGFLREGQPISNAEGHTLVDEVAADLTTEARVLFADDPALGFGSIVTDIGDDGQPRTDETTEQLPTVLFEPRQTLVFRDPTGQAPSKETHTETALLMGMQHIRYGVYNLSALHGWALHRTNDGLALHDSHGNVFATAGMTLDPQWVSAAAAQQWVLVLYGIRLGVRTPPGVNPEQYTADARRAEVTEARKQGLVTGGLVRWHG